MSDGEGGGLGTLGWINTVDTKGLGGRDLLFSPSLPSISLNPALLAPGFEQEVRDTESSRCKHVVVVVGEGQGGGGLKIMQGAKKSS